MRRLLKWLGTVLLFLLVALSFAPTLVPPFLDRIYYAGPASDHFDGRRFFNPGTREPPRLDPRRFFNRWMQGERAVWPDSAPVQQTVPPRNVAGDGMRVTWIGHSTVLVQVNGLNILTDPIWSDRASPFSFIGPRRVRAPGVRFEDLPRIHLVVVSHNHYDHMDLPTLKRLWERDRPLIVTSLGNDTILRGEGIEAVTRDWGGRVLVPGGGEVVVLRNHHWGSRWGTDRNRALWSAFSIRTPHGNIFFAGDTGWGDGSWVREAARAGPYRLAIIPIGAFLPRDVMQNSHVGPEEALAIFRLLDPRMALAVHWGTFQLSFEGMDQPPQVLADLQRQQGLPPGRFIATAVGQPFSVPAR
ncbi:MAG TPA: MBL fold metallo-hydrolase [Allosphingosinicella sp.]|nr:MBL fold metallo-hydrolase [Allosphingosinicella sp.]